jgi:hypothetical protein
MKKKFRGYDSNLKAEKKKKNKVLYTSQIAHLEILVLI